MIGEAVTQRLFMASVREMGRIAHRRRLVEFVFWLGYAAGRRAAAQDLEQDRAHHAVAAQRAAEQFRVQRANRRLTRS